MLSLVAIGMICWINQHPDEALTHNLYDLDFERNPLQSVRTFRERTAVTTATCRALGSAAIDQTCSRSYRNVDLELPDGSRLEVLRRFDQNWHLVDGTKAIGTRDQTLRYQVGPNWYRNSCALDCVLVCAIQLDVGRRIVDQIRPDERRQLTPPALLTRYIVHQPWGLLTEQQRDSLRDLLRDCIIHHNPRTFPGAGAMWPLMSLVELCLSRLPQLSYTMVQGTYCCDRVLMYSGHRTSRRTGFDLLLSNTVRENLGEAMTRVMMEGQHSVRLDNCRTGSSCTRQVRRVPFLLDRPPPVLLLRCGVPVTRAQNRNLRLLHDFHFLYRRIVDGGEMQRCRVAYRLLGCIFMVHWNHFITRWRYGGKIYSYDQAHGLVRTKDWWTGLVETADPGVCVAFYQIDDRDVPPAQ